MNNKIQYGALFLLFLSCSINARPMAIMHEKTFDLSSHELSIQQPVMCPGDNKENITSNLDVGATNSTGNLTCTLCIVLVNIIDNQIQRGNNTIIEITEIIKDICSFIKGSSGKTCLVIIKNIQIIVQWITEGITKDEICYKLHLCNSTLTNSIY